MMKQMVPRKKKDEEYLFIIIIIIIIISKIDMQQTAHVVVGRNRGPLQPKLP
jgi:hypothetical protein